MVLVGVFDTYQEGELPRFPELLLHIGAGKTGSTSIQFTLRSAGSELEKSGLGYFGLMLEQIPNARAYPWCVEGAPQVFFRASDKVKADRELAEIALEELARLGKQSVERVVWSNEAFLTRADRMIPIFRRLTDAGVPITPICYVRRHDGWARSGYVQFGIKFKTYDGPQRRFAEWVQDMDLSYAPSLVRWSSAFPALEIYNFDALPNVTEHFLKRVGADAITPVRANDQPGNALLAAWAVFNGRIKGRALPTVFQRFAKRLKMLPGQSDHVPKLSDLMPSPEELSKVRAAYEADFTAVNEMLREQGQPAIVFDGLEAKSSEIDPWEMNQLLLSAVYSLQRQVFELEEKIATLAPEQGVSSLPRQR